MVAVRQGPPPMVATAVARSPVSFGAPVEGAGHRVVLYGPGGIGKTTLAASAPGPVVFFDLDDSLSRLKISGAKIVSAIESWDALRKALQGDGWEGIKTIVIDSTTKAEEMAVAETLRTITADGGKHVANVEGYGYGKGYGFVYDVFLPLLSDLDRHCRAGRNVILICHDCTTTVPNPAGEDWLRYEPRLQSPPSGKASIRLRVREWADHVLFIGYDVSVDKNRKGTGSGTRTLYPCELPHCMAKSRACQNSMVLSGDVWGQIIK